MANALWTRLAQGRQTSDFPRGTVQFPERFRGRPIVTDASGHAVLDVGACLFAPEETGNGDKPVLTFTHDHRLAVSARDDFCTQTGALPPVRALDARMRGLLGRSLRLRSVAAGSCGGCEAEMTAMSNVVFDLARFGVQFVASPRHADGIVVTGVVNANMREALLRTYDAVPDPRIVIAVGACAVSGGVFADGTDVAGVGSIVPVDLWIAGCPPHPLTIMDGLLRLLGRLEDGQRATP